MTEPTESSKLSCPAFCSSRLTRVILAIVLLGSIAWCVFQAYGPDRDSPQSEQDGEAVTIAVEPLTAEAVVRLTPEKMAASRIDWAPVKRQPLRYSYRVAGKLDYVASRVLDLRVPVACTVKKVRVTPGQMLAEGEPLALLSAVEIGRARDDVRDREADLRVAEQEYEWLEDVAGNVDELVAFLDQQPSMDPVEQKFATRRLGSHRSQLLPAYSRLLLAQQMIATSQGLATEGVLSNRTLQERQSNLEVARAEYRGAREQARQGAAMEQARAVAGLRQAERLLRVSSEYLATLLGPFSAADAEEVDGDTPLNDFLLRAPFSGRVEATYAVPALQMPANGPLFRFANTDTLWASAQIHDRYWSALSVNVGHELTISSPALDDRQFPARVQFVGASVSPENRTIPLVAELDNTRQDLKPGMFVWVTIPLETSHPTLAVPTGALLRHEGQAFVFVREGEDSFRRIDVVTGLETPEWVEITQGLDEGESVVVRGAFALKSELLLEREDE